VIRGAVRAVIATLVLAVLTGLIYPLVITGVGQVAFHGRANGSLVYQKGRTIGSSLVGQQWRGAQWFYGRPSAASYDAAASSASNLGPLSREFAAEIRRRITAILDVEGPYHSGLEASAIPVDLLTASASGLDPDISPAAAYFQAPRIAEVRHLSLSQVRALIQAHIEGRTLGVLGEPLVNVLELNLALQGAAG